MPGVPGRTRPGGIADPLADGNLSPTLATIPLTSLIRPGRVGVAWTPMTGKQTVRRKQDVHFAPLINLTLIFAAGGLGLTALGVAGLLNVIRGGQALAVLSLVAAVGVFALAGYFVWGMKSIKKRPELMRKAAEQQNTEKRHSQGT